MHTHAQAHTETHTQTYTHNTVSIVAKKATDPFAVPVQERQCGLHVDWYETGCWGRSVE